jgi:AraC-like DNA-binding protein/mannose-6-phosphate isomerase-like protein (cupin superfamily)
MKAVRNNLTTINSSVMNTAYSYTKEESFSNMNSPVSGGTSNEKAKRFEIQSLEWLETQQLSWNDKSLKPDWFEVLWIKKGEGNIWLDDECFEISNNTIYCLAPAHTRKCILHPNAEGCFISFAPEFIWLSEGSSNNSSWLDRYNDEFKSAVIKVDEETNHEIELIVRKMKWEFNNYFNQRIELLKGLLNIFLIYISRNIGAPAGNINYTREAELVRKFMNLLKKHFIDKKMVSDYAMQLCVTPNYLNRTVKKVTGFTASHHIQQKIILEAKRKAIYSTITMKEIAYGLGFDNLAHFSKFFKNNCGMSFTDYKKQVLRPI